MSKKRAVSEIPDGSRTGASGRFWSVWSGLPNIKPSYNKNQYTTVGQVIAIGGCTPEVSSGWRLQPHPARHSRYLADIGQ